MMNRQRSVSLWPFDFAANSILSLIWTFSVRNIVPEPYLDEVFHIGQAETFVAGLFGVWDPKITTPPGLYLLSYVLPYFRRGTNQLRGIGAVCLLMVQFVVRAIYGERKASAHQAYLASHSALNVFLFPPLFFFSALYYTDLPSTLSVLVFYWVFLRLDTLQVPPLGRLLTLLPIGTTSLLFRQTNIFWVAIFPAGLVLVHRIDDGHEAVKKSMHEREKGFGDSLISVARTSWKFGAVYEPPIRDAWIDGMNDVALLSRCTMTYIDIDFFRTIMSLLICTIRQFSSLQKVRQTCLDLAPFLSLLGLFASFVIWNGSVVLGDKSNHVATLHLPQMLYLWPYITFFSWPLVYPYLLAFPVAFVARLSTFASLEPLLLLKRRRILPRAKTLAACIVLANLAVASNTIVHPFTLADNRHYTFYVFRYLMNPWWIKHVASTAYILTAWACIQALGRGHLAVVLAQTDKATPTPNARRPVRKSLVQDASTGPTTPFLIVWLLTTTLQLINAPLVEPRYCIVPWIFWRIHLPLPQTTLARVSIRQPQLSQEGHIEKPLVVTPPPRQKWDGRFLMETAWFVAVNAATGYMFLYRGFEWTQEPGKIQRFMW